MRRFPIWLCALMLATQSRLGAQQKVELLFTGDFLEERVWPKTGERWLGLYRASPGFRLVPTAIRVTRVPDACADSATKVSADTAVQPYLLIKGHRSFRTGVVDTAFAGNEFFYPGKSTSIKIGKPERWYHIRALGSAGVRGGEVLFKDYRLELHHSERLDAGQSIWQTDGLTLDNTPNLQWAGDLDRDQRLDVLLLVPIGGYSKRYLLFLSSAASGPELVKAVASFDVLDC